MPKNDNPKRKTFRKRNNRKIVSRKKSKIVGPFRTINSQDPFPSMYSCKLTYSENFLFTTGTGGLLGAEQIMRCNSVHDPNFTGTGHSPYGYDQLSPLYRKYKVNAVQVELVYTDPSEDGLYIAAMFQPPGGAFTLAGKVGYQIKEQPMSITRAISNSGKQVGIIKQYFPISKISGLTKMQHAADIDLFSALVSQNPAAVPLLRFSVGSDRGIANATMIVKAKITYWTTFYERVIQNIS